jgi:hypothetical protein
MEQLKSAQWKWNRRTFLQGPIVTAVEKCQHDVRDRHRAPLSTLEGIRLSRILHAGLGLISISFRRLLLEEMIDLAVKAKLASIEWGGRVHVPQGESANCPSYRVIYSQSRV